VLIFVKIVLSTKHKTKSDTSGNTTETQKTQSTCKKKTEMRRQKEEKKKSLIWNTNKQHQVLTT